MTVKGKIIIGILVSFIILAIMVFFAYKQSLHIKRDSEVLFNKYFQFRKSNPKAAKQALQLILQQNPNDIPALTYLSNILIKENKLEQALPLVQARHRLAPDNEEYTLQLARLYYELGYWQEATKLAQLLKYKTSLSTRLSSQDLLNAMASEITNYHYMATITPAISKEFAAYKADESLVARILLDYYYHLRKANPKHADKLLPAIYKLNPNNLLVVQELGYQYLRQKKNKEAIFYFLYVYYQHPSAQIAMQLAYLYYDEKKIKQAQAFFLQASLLGSQDIKEKALDAYAYLKRLETFNFYPSLPAAQVFEQGNKSTLSSARFLPHSSSEKRSDLITMSRINFLLDQFYLIKKYNEHKAWLLIQAIIKEFPENIMALKEGGYLAIKLKNSTYALDYFTRVYLLTYDPNIALQLGYLHDARSTTDKYLAYQYFKLATKNTNPELALRAQRSMTNLAGLQTKVLPYPYFSEIFFEPFSQTRFGLTVRPLVARLGVEPINRLRSKAYLVYRQTDDNKSANQGNLPQIYEDNVAILGVGVQLSPIPQLPLVAFMESGGAYDLVYRNRGRWRGDLRAGLMYYQDLGAFPSYFDKPEIGFHYYGNLYGDAVYFSRYDNNVIALFRTHQGIRALQYKSSMLNLYVTARTIVDTRREFYNNIAEIGPGISFIPSNRFKVLIRYEAIRGVYLPVGGLSVNPYSKYYNNRIIQLLAYVKM